MNRWAANNPELYEQLGHDGYLDYFREAADMERKRQKEEPMCRVCGEYPRRSWSAATCKRCAASIEEDRLNQGLYACPTCGEPVRHYGQRCERCKRNMEDDRLERESGR